MRHLFILLVLAACSSSEDAKATCEGPLGKPLQLSEIDAMSACCQAEPDGQAHCLDAAKVPGALQSFVATCESGGYCIPDSMLATGASQPPATCTAFGGQAVCLSRCIPQVAENAALLRKDTCAGVDELCVPCISPLDNMPTGACDLLAFSTCVGAAPPEDPTAACDDPATCNYTGVCLSDCLDFGIQGVALARGDCQSGYKCAPCEQNGEPTGAPGCPP